MSINLTPIASNNLVSLRQEFKDTSGLAGLSNSEIDLWLNRGLVMLDLMTEFVHSPARQTIVIPKDTWLCKFLSGCLAIQSVWCIDAAAPAREPITLVSYNAFKEVYKSIVNADGGRPLHATLAVTRAADANSVAGITPIYDPWAESEVPGDTYRALILGPKADKEYQIEIIGKFYSTVLSDGNQTNWWIANHADTVLAAAMYKLTLLKFRNREAAGDYLQEVKMSTTGLDYNTAEHDANRVSQMEG